MRLIVGADEDTAYDQVWIGLKKASNGNWYYLRSGKQVNHEGSDKHEIWKNSYPSNSGSCSKFDFFFNPSGIIGELTDFDCEGSTIDVTLCQIPYLYI